MDSGLEEFSKFLIDNGIRILAVATTEEALSIRKINDEIEILNMSSTSIKEEMEKLIDNNITITIGSLQAANLANDFARNGKHLKAHIKIDTGFGRYGFIYQDKGTIINVIKNLDENIKLQGIFTHFSLAYYKNSPSTIKQYKAFIEVINAIEKEGINIELKHACNSPAFLNFPNMRLNAARIGSAFLGRVDTGGISLGLKKIGKMKSQITEIKLLPKDFNVGYLDTYKTKKETKVAIVPIGYKDGFNMGTKEDMFRTVDKLRNLKHLVFSLLKKQKLTVWINNKYYNVIGKIGMYHMAIDISEGAVNIGDSVELNVNPIFVDSSVRREYE